jgi:hypothetical protein
VIKGKTLFRIDGTTFADRVLWKRWVARHPLTMHKPSNPEGGITIYFTFEDKVHGIPMLLLDGDGLPCMFNRIERARVFAAGDCTYRQHWVVKHDANRKEGEYHMEPCTNKRYRNWLKREGLEMPPPHEVEHIEVHRGRDPVPVP